MTKNDRRVAQIATIVSLIEQGISRSDIRGILRVIGGMGAGEIAVLLGEVDGYFKREREAERDEIGEVLHAEETVTESANPLLDSAIALVTAFQAGDIRAFNAESSMLQTMTGRAVYGEGWSKRWTIKNLADGIIIREGR